MTTTDYLINIGLVALVIVQIRGGRLTLRTAIRPVACVAAAAFYYLRGIPTAGNDVLLDAVLGCAGLVLGVACAATTRVYRGEGGAPYAKAGAAAAALWVLGLGSRLAFEELWTHGGTHAITSFSIAHDITSQNAWVAGLVMMALAEVISRLVVIRIRAARLPGGAVVPVLAAAGLAA
ncbi:MAG TPA: hypothetical protein VMD59_04290 [Acidimicrobiales bacterium]|nr:hypothetical protein [Acidimicrobiales bacterium]